MNVHLTSLVILKSLSLFVCDILIGYLEANIAENEENCAVKIQARMYCLFLFEQLGSQVNYRPQVSPSTGGSHLGIQHPSKTSNNRPPSGSENINFSNLFLEFRVRCFVVVVVSNVCLFVCVSGIYATDSSVMCQCSALRTNGF